MPGSFRRLDLRDALASQTPGSTARLAATLLGTLFAGTALVDALRWADAPSPVTAPLHQVAGPSHAPVRSTTGQDQQEDLYPAPMLKFLKFSADEAYLTNAAIPNSKIVDPPARPFYMATVDPVDAGLASRCLTQAVYYEAASEGLDGQRAVAQVVLNRVRDQRFPKTVCGVVFDGSGLRTGCQFSFTCDGSLERPPAPAAWSKAQAVADAALSGYVMKAIGHATHYHTIWVTPYWAPSLQKWGRLGSHIFYRWSSGAPLSAIGLSPGPGPRPTSGPMSKDPPPTASPALPPGLTAESVAVAVATSPSKVASIVAPALSPTDR